LWDDVLTLGPTRISTPLAWLGLVAFGFQIYFDFSGYSLMAIGMGKMLGFEFPDNFNYPYISLSMTEFWKRWHMTLGSWFREYVYIPLGGNRKGLIRQILNLLIVWLLTGLWHGASINFILWGLYFFVLLASEKLFLLRPLSRHKLFARVYFILGILVGWSIFAITDLQVLSLYLNRMFVFHSGIDWIYFSSNYGVILLACGLFSTPFITKIKDIKLVSPILNLSTALIFIISITYLVDSTYNPFLYFRS
jgi:alginate O-acetyltransferase complex protein AlgI